MCSLTEEAKPADVIDRCRCVASLLVEMLAQDGGDGSLSLSPRASHGLCLVLLDLDQALADAERHL